MLSQAGALGHSSLAMLAFSPKIGESVVLLEKMASTSCASIHWRRLLQRNDDSFLEAAVFDLNSSRIPDARLCMSFAN